MFIVFLQNLCTFAPVVRDDFEMKVPAKYYDEQFEFKGQWDMPSKCGLKIFDYKGKKVVVVTELYQENPGTSVTYAGCVNITVYLEHNLLGGLLCSQC